MESVFTRAFAELNAAQLAVLKTFLRVKLLALMLPRQVGKTHLGIWMVREVMRQNTNTQALFLAKDFPSIQRNTQEKFLKLFPEEEFEVSSKGVRHPNPSQHKNRGYCFLSGVDKNPHKIRGGTMGIVHWSEVAFSRFEQGSSFRTVHETVVLPTISRTDGYYLMESTPFGTNFWKDFWEDDSNNFTKVKFPLELCIALGAITRDQADKMERAMHPDVFKQEMLCDFVTFMGKIYKEYDPEKHDAKIDGPEPHERIVVGMDIGTTAAFVALFAVWRKGKLCIFDQIYQDGLRPDQMAAMLEERLRFWKIESRRVACYTDHDIEVVEELQRRKIPVDLADKVDRFACRLDLKSAFHFDQINLEPIRCEKLKKEVGAATWSETKTDEMEERGDPNGHHWDSEAALRYLWRGSKLEVEAPEHKPEHVEKNVDDAVEWQMREERRALKRERDAEREKAGVKPGEAEVFEY